MIFKTKLFFYNYIDVELICIDVEWNYEISHVLNYLYLIMLLNYRYDFYLTTSGLTLYLVYINLCFYKKHLVNCLCYISKLWNVHAYYYNTY